MSSPFRAPNRLLRAARESRHESREEFARLVEVAAGAPVDARMIKRWEVDGVTPRPIFRRAVIAVTGRRAAELGWVAADHYGDNDSRGRLAYALEKGRPDLAVVGSLAEVQAALRRTEDEVSAGPVLSPALAQAGLVDALTTDASGTVRTALIREGAQWSQFAGWLHADSGDDAQAERWYLRAGEMAREAGDADMAATVLSMRSQRAWGTGCGLLAVGLAEGALAVPGTCDAVRSQAAQQLARGLAMTGGGDRVDRLLDEAEELAHAAAGDPERIPPWMYFHDPARVAVQRGIAYVEAGRAADAVEVLTDAIGRTRPEEVRDRGWNHGRLTLAHAMNGTAEAAVTSARAAVAIAARSPHTAADLRQAARLLRTRAPRHAAELHAMAEG